MIQRDPVSSARPCAAVLIFAKCGCQKNIKRVQSKGPNKLETSTINKINKHCLVHPFFINVEVQAFLPLGIDKSWVPKKLDGWLPGTECQIARVPCCDVGAWTSRWHSPWPFDQRSAPLQPEVVEPWSQPESVTVTGTWMGDYGQLGISSINMGMTNLATWAVYTTWGITDILWNLEQALHPSFPKFLERLGFCSSSQSSAKERCNDLSAPSHSRNRSLDQHQSVWSQWTYFPESQHFWCEQKSPGARKSRPKRFTTEVVSQVDPKAIPRIRDTSTTSQENQWTTIYESYQEKGQSTHPTPNLWVSRVSVDIIRT